jgi:transcriptional regulator of acetoin/glycerol metabolism
VAVPILDTQGNALAALAVVGSPAHFTEARIKSIVPILQRAAKTVENDEAFAQDVDAVIRRGRIRAVPRAKVAPGAA